MSAKSRLKLKNTSGLLISLKSFCLKKGISDLCILIIKFEINRRSNELG